MKASTTKAGGGWPAIIYTVRKALEVGPLKLWTRMRSRNACKTCAFGMGGQLGGMTNEAKHFPEVCKKSLQAQAADMKGYVDLTFFEHNDLTKLLDLSPKQAEDAGRLTFPVILGPETKHYQPIDWQSALELIANQLRATEPRRVAFYASGRSSNEAAFLLQSFARVYGTNNVMNCSFYCHQASSVALKNSFGTGCATVTLEDIERADLVVLLGANPASNHPRLITQLAQLRQRGGQVIVVNPIREPGLERFHIPSKITSLLFGSEISSQYVQLLAGGDLALLLGVLKSLDESQSIEQAFLDLYTEGADQVLGNCQKLSWSEIEKSAGVAKETIEMVASTIAKANSVIFCWGMGLTQHSHGVDNIQALINVALATGNVGKPGAGLLPLRGHSNVQGIGSVGFTPHLQDGIRAALEKAYDRTLPLEAGLDTHAMVQAADNGQIDVLIALGGNLWGSNPDSQWAARSLQKIKTIVYLSTKLNPGHFHGRGQTTIILPVLARDEEPQSTTQESMFNFVRLSDGGTANVKGQMQAESRIICDLAEAVLGRESFNWSLLRNHSEIRRLISEAIPGWKEIGDIDKHKREFTISSRIYHSPNFNTNSGRAKMQATPLPQNTGDGLRLITLRSEGQFNTVVYEPYDVYRDIQHRHTIMISQEDAQKLSLNQGQKVSVIGESGKMDDVEIHISKIKPGVVAMFYPEANILIKSNIDKQSKTPAFKNAPVWIKP